MKCTYILHELFRSSVFHFFRTENDDTFFTQNVLAFLCLLCGQLLLLKLPFPFFHSNTNELVSFGTVLPTKMPCKRLFPLIKLGSRTLPTSYLSLEGIFNHQQSFILEYIRGKRLAMLVP